MFCAILSTCRKGLCSSLFFSRFIGGYKSDGQFCPVAGAHYGGSTDHLETARSQCRG